MTVAHILGIPVEEAVVQFAAAGAAATGVAIAARTKLVRLRTRITKRAWKQ